MPPIWLVARHVAGRLATLGVLVAIALGAHAQVPAATPPPAADASSMSRPEREHPRAAAEGSLMGAPRAEAAAPLVIYNRTIFVFRSTFLGVTPPDRAKVAEERILQVLGRPGRLPTGVEGAPQGAIVRIDGVFAFVVSPADVDALAGETTLGVAQQAARVLDTVIAETREARDIHAMLVATALAALATAICLAAVWGLRRTRRALGRRLLEATAQQAERVQVGGIAVLPEDRVRDWARRALNAAFWLLTLVVVYEWLGYVLRRFPYTRPWGEKLTAFLAGTGRQILEGIAHAIPGLAIALVIFVIARAVARACDAFLRRVQSGNARVGWLDADTALPTRRLVTILVWAFAVVMAYPYLPGSNTEAFKGMSVLIGLMVSLGASSVIAQGASGLILMYTRALRPGDYVRIGEHRGVVVGLSAFATRLRTPEGVELTLPSALVLGSATLNYSRTRRGDGYIAHTKVTIGYDVPWRQVHAMLLEAARRTPGIEPDPPPEVVQDALSDFYVEYCLSCQGSSAMRRPELISALHANVLDVFNEHGVQIMSPNYEADPEIPKVVPKERWFEPPAVKPRQPGTAG